MKRALFLSTLAIALVACSQTADGESRPTLPSGVEVRFPPAPTGSYLSLLTEGGQSVYQVAVEAGKTSVAVEAGKWATQSTNAVPILDLLPADAQNVSVNTAGIKANLLHWIMWQDRNSNGTRDDGEMLDLMTHDRVAYASQAAEVKFSNGKVQQVWKLTSGWSRAEHYVYLPLDSDTYWRSLTSAGLQRYELHVPTPVTSQ